MIVRRVKWLLLMAFVAPIASQNARSYDTNDWIPINPLTDNTKQASGRVLNLDAPNQKFFPDQDYTRKRAQIPQYLQETPPKGPRYPKIQEPYKFEPVVSSLSPKPQYVQPNIQYVQPGRQILNQALIAPPLQANHQNYYDNGQTQQQYTPRNNTYYQSLNAGSINGELLGVPQIQVSSTTPKAEEKESVQLLYVPLESLKPSQPIPQQSQNFYQQNSLPRQENTIVGSGQGHKQIQLDTIENDFVRQALASHKLQQQLLLGQPIVFQGSTTTTPKPKKRKANQPPLAVYMGSQGHANVKDVLNVLKHAKTIPVQDSLGPDSPQVFVGPSNLKEVDGFTKFPLPYLSSVEGNRIERKVDHLPFFVAPLSYKTPEGYSKIPLPSPHVGSVVISTKDDSEEKVPVTRQTTYSQNQFESPTPYVLPNSQNQNPNGLLTFNYNEGLSNYQVNNPQPTRNYVSNPVTEQFYQDSNYRSSTPKTQVDYNEDNKNLDQLYNYRQISSTPKSPSTVFNYNEEAVTPRVQPNHFSYTQESIKESTPTNPPSVVSYTEPSLLPTRIPYSYNEEPIRPTTTESSEQYHRFQQQTNPLRQYELQQINQFIEESEPEEEVPTTTTARTRSRQRQRFRLTTNAPLGSTEKYTVLEEFSIKQKPTTDNYRTEVETIPANVFKLETNAPEQVYTENVVQNQQPSAHRQIYREEYVQNQQNTPTSQYLINTQENPSGPGVYSGLREETNKESHQKQSDSIQQQTFNEAPGQTQFLYDSVSEVGLNNQEIYTEEPQLKQHILNQDMLDQQILRQRPPTSTEKQSFVYQTEEPQNQDPHLAPLVYNRGQNVENSEVNQVHSFIPGLINNLQNQAVRPLLNPNLLVPTTEKLLTSSIPVTPEEIQQIATTTEPARIETTTRKLRGRQRGTTSSRYSTTTTPRRTVTRRRTVPTRSTTVRSITNSDYDATKRTVSSRQRFRTRGRPVSNSHERISQTTTESVQQFKPASLEGGFQASSGEPQSYMQFEHTVDDQSIITVKPDAADDGQVIKEYHQVYSLPTNDGGTGGSRPVIDVQITHAMTTERIDKGRGRTEHIQSGGVIYNSRNEDSTSKNVRTRGRSRIRKPSSTARPTTTTTTSTEKQDDANEEFYGFIRNPNFSRTASLVHTTTDPPVAEISSRTVIHLDDEQDNEEVAPVRFVGEIRPKYHSTTPLSEEVPATTEPSRTRIRNRVRIPTRSRASTTEQHHNGLKSNLDDQVTRRSNQVRTRGKSHFKLPESATKTISEDDVEGGNYPASYLKLTTEKPGGFQITIDPYGDNEDDDQVPHSSIFRPKVLPNPEWVDASILPPLNDLPMEDKKMIVTSNSMEETTDAYQEEATDSIESTTTEEAEITTVKKKGGRRRGVWKLVKQRPLDQFETAESQNYESVLNSFDQIAKQPRPTLDIIPISSTTAAPSTTSEGTIFDTLYSMLGMSATGEEVEDSNGTISTTVNEESTTTALPPTFPEEYTEQPTTQSSENEEEEVDTESVGKETNEDIPAWNMRQVKTSTSTEVSHETEICYKGRCIKSKEDTRKL